MVFEVAEPVAKIDQLALKLGDPALDDAALAVGCIAQCREVARPLIGQELRRCGQFRARRLPRGGRSG